MMIMIMIPNNSGDDNERSSWNKDQLPYDDSDHQIFTSAETSAYMWSSTISTISNIYNIHDIHRSPDIHQRGNIGICSSTI